MSGRSRTHSRRAFLQSAAALLGGTFLGVRVAQARPNRRLLVVAYCGPFGRDRAVQAFPGNVAGAEFDSAWHWGRRRGDLARLLGEGSYDQVWLWDQEIRLPAMDAADAAALAEWFDAHPNIVLDSRSCAFRFANDAAERRLAQNIRDALDAEGGGLWLGASQAPNYCATANTWLRHIESGQFTGSFEDDGPLTGDADHPFLAGVQVDDLRFLVARSFPRGVAPTLGPGEAALHTVVSDHRGNPLITTSIGGPGAFLRTDWQRLFAARPQAKRRA